MKKIFALAAVSAAVIATPAAAQSATANDGVATATVVAPISVTHTNGAALSFGSFASGAAGSIVVNAADGIASTTGVTILAGSTSSADRFDVTGEGNRTFSISTTGGSLANTTGTTGTPMTFVTASSNTGTLVSGVANFRVGGTLTVPATVNSGVYVGSYSATVAYN